MVISASWALARHLNGISSVLVSKRKYALKIIPPYYMYIYTSYTITSEVQTGTHLRLYTRSIFLFFGFFRARRATCKKRPDTNFANSCNLSLGVACRARTHVRSRASLDLLPRQLQTRPQPQERSITCVLEIKYPTKGAENPPCRRGRRPAQANPNSAHTTLHLLARHPLDVPMGEPMRFSTTW